MGKYAHVQLDAFTQELDVKTTAYTKKTRDNAIVISPSLLRVYA